jgi:hypothetical protein
LHAAELSDLPERDVLRFAEEICQLADDTHRFVRSLPPASAPPPPEKMVGAR